MKWLTTPGDALQDLPGLDVDVLEDGSLEKVEELFAVRMSEPFV